MTQNATAYHANNAYRSAAVAVPPLKAVVMLCDGAITLLQKAQEAHDAKRFEEGHTYLTRATAILRGLSHNLDFTRGGAMADRLYRTYNALIMACLRSYGRPCERELSAHHRQPDGTPRRLEVRRGNRRQGRQGQG